MIVEFESNQYNFPDDASDGEISGALKKYGAATWSKTREAIGPTAVGGVQKAVGGVIRKLGEMEPASLAAAHPVLALPAIGIERGLAAAGIDLTRERTGVEKKLVEVGTGIAESGELNMEEASPGDMNFWQRIVLGGTSSFAQMAPTLVLGAAMKTRGATTPAAVAAPVGTAATLAGGGTYAETREKGISIPQATAHMAVDATAEAVFEMIPMKFLLDNLGGPTLKLLATYYVKEGYTEALTTAVQSANAKISTRPDMTFKEYGQDILDTIGSVAVSAPLAVGTGAAVHRVLRPTEGAAPSGGDNAPLPPPTSPAFDQPSTPVPPDQLVGIDTLIKSIDAELLTDQDVADAKVKVATAEAARRTPNLPEAGPAWTPMLAANTGEIGTDVSESGATLRQAGKHLKYAGLNENDQVDRWDRTFTLATDPEAVGRIPKQVLPKPGTYLLGQESEDRPVGLLNAYYDTMESWRQKHLPNATFVIANESLDTGTTLGMHFSSEPGKHFFVPAVLRSPKKGLGQFNKNTQAGVFYNASHEFGHAVIEDQLFGKMQPEQAGAIRRAAETGIVPEELLDGLSETEVALIREFNSVKSRLVGNTITAQELTDTWLGPAKLGREFLKDLDVAPDAPGINVLKAIVSRQTKQAENEGLGRQAVRALRQKTKNEYFGLDEYLAEQMARAAYQQKWDEQSQLGKFFQGALSALRRFFVDAKKDGVIKAGTAFNDWLAGLSKIDKATREPQRISESKLRGGERKPKEPIVAVPKPRIKLKPQVEKVQHNVETSTDEGKAVEARRLTTGLVRTGAIEANGPEMKELLGLVRDKDWEAFLERFAQLSGKTAKFELDPEIQGTRWTKIWTNDLNVLRAGIPEDQIKNPSVLADAAREWKEKQFRSKYFKAHFGDWENDKENASKVLNQEGAPLVLSHLSRIGLASNATEPFDVFDRGDIGFHWGTVRAAHARGYAPLTERQFGPPSLEAVHEELEKLGQQSAKGQEDETKLRFTNDTYLIQGTLNLRNPLRFGQEQTGLWSHPQDTARILRKAGFIDQEDYTALFDRLRAPEELERVRAIQDPWVRTYQWFEPVRQLLVAKGYDGVVYENVVEGDTTFVAFHPNQVKSLLGAKTFSRSDNFSFETDFDLAREEGAGASKMFKGVKNWLADMKPLQRALRRAQRLAPHVLQIQQLAHLHPDVEGIQMFVERNTGYNTTKSRVQAPADSVIGDWASPWLGKENSAKIGKTLNDELDGGELWFDVQKTPQGYRYAMSQRAETELKARGIDISTAEGEELGGLVLAAKNALMTQINALEHALETVLKNRYASGGPDVLLASMKPMKRAIHQIRKSPFFPRGHFGNMMLVVQRKKEAGPGWETVHREAFESRDMWEEAFAKAVARTKPDERIRKFPLSDKDYVMLGLPLDFVDLAASELGLEDTPGPNGEPSQVERLMELLQPTKIEKPLKQFDLERLKIKGYSADSLRSFAAFTWHNANLIAKLEFRSEFNAAIRAVDAELRRAQYSQAPESLEESEKLDRIKRAMQQARDYIMAPENEAQALRTAVSVMYLGLNVKTAVINFYGLVTSWSDLTTRFGQAEGNKRFFKSMAQAISSIQLTDLNAAKDLGWMDPDTKAALARALEEGVLSQSYAYHLAGMANAGTLWRMPATNTLSRIGKGGVDLAMWPFRLTELASRRAAFIAEFEAAKDHPSEELTNPYDEAVRRTNILMNDYSHGNRVPFMRGNALHMGPVMPLATIFMSFAQHMAFHSYGGYEVGERRAAAARGESPRAALGGYTMKIWLLTLLLAGYEGLPGAENLIDLVSALWRKWGDGEPIRKKLREMVQSLEVDWLSPGLAAHGLGYNLAGYDVSRSVGFGRLIPGTDVLAHPRADPEEQVGDFIFDVAGPMGGFIKFGLGALTGPKTTAEAFERLPGGMGNIYVAYRWSEHGVRASDGSLVTIDKETGKLRDLTAAEIIGKAFGLNPTIVSENRQIRFDQFDQQMYWQARRKKLLDDVWRARWQKDREAEADARKAVSDYNASIPAKDKTLRISGADVARSLQAHERLKRFEEQGKTPQRRYRPLYEETRESYR